MGQATFEGLALGARALARAESRAEVGMRVGPTAREVLANVDAMRAAMNAATADCPFAIADIADIHRRVMAHAPNRHMAGEVRTVQNSIGGNDYNPCGADFVPPPPGPSPRCMPRCANWWMQGCCFPCRHPGATVCGRRRGCSIWWRGWTRGGRHSAWWARRRRRPCLTTTTSSRHRGHVVERNTRITRHQGQPLGLRLGDQHSVERVTVARW